MPGIAGTTARPPTLIKLRSARTPLAGDFHFLRRREPGVAAVERDVCGVFDGGSKPISRRRHNRILARFNLPHVDAVITPDHLARFNLPHVDAVITPDHHTILGGAPRGPGGIGARYQGLGRGAAGVGAGAANETALD